MVIPRTCFILTETKLIDLSSFEIRPANDFPGVPCLVSFSLPNPSLLAFIILDHNVTIFDRFEISLYYSQPSCTIRTLCVLSINFVTNEDVRIQLFLFETSEEKISVFAMAVVVYIDLIIILFALQVHSSVRPSACLSVRSYIRFVIESSNFSSQRFGNLISYDLLICFHLLGIEASPLCFQLLFFFLEDEVEGAIWNLSFRFI